MSQGDKTSVVVSTIYTYTQMLFSCSREVNYISLAISNQLHKFRVGYEAQVALVACDEFDLEKKSSSSMYNTFYSGSIYCR